MVDSPARGPGEALALAGGAQLAAHPAAHQRMSSTPQPERRERSGTGSNRGQGERRKRRGAEGEQSDSGARLGPDQHRDDLAPRPPTRIRSLHGASVLSEPSSSSATGENLQGAGGHGGGNLRPRRVSPSALAPSSSGVREGCGTARGPRAFGAPAAARGRGRRRWRWAAAPGHAGRFTANCDGPGCRGPGPRAVAEAGSGEPTMCRKPASAALYG